MAVGKIVQIEVVYNAFTQDVIMYALTVNGKIFVRHWTEGGKYTPWEEMDLPE